MAEADGARLSVGAAALEGLRLIGARPASVLAWSVVYLLLAVLPAVVVAWLRAAGGAPHASFSESTALVVATLPYVSPIAWAVIGTAIYRAIMHPDRVAAFSLRLTRAELWQFVLQLFQWILLAVLSIAGVFLSGVTVGVSGLLPVPLGLLLRVAGPLAAGVLAAWLWLRLAMAGPMSFGQGRLRLFGSWALTRGRDLSMAWLALATLGMTALVALLILITLFGLGEVIAGMLRWSGDQMQGFFVGPVRLSAAPWLIGSALLGSVVMVVLQCVALAPWARAYLDMATVAPSCTLRPRTPVLASAFGGIAARARFGAAWTAPVILVLAMSLAMGLLTVGLAIWLAMTGQAASASRAMQGWITELGLSVVFDLLTVALLVLWARTAEQRPWSSLGLGGSVRISDIGWFVVGGIWAFVLALGLGMAAQAVTTAVMDPAGSADALALPQSALAQAPAVLVVIVLLAFSEEVMFRGWLLSALAPRTGLPAAIAGSSLLFAAFHVMPWELGDPARLVSFLSYTAIGAGFAAVALRRGQVWSSTALHSGYNSFLAFATMASQHATPHKLWNAVSDEKRGSSDFDQAWMTLGLNLAIAAVMIGVLLWARRRAVDRLAAAPAG
jgi:membrane protease YdiL (CAAX protease family)